MGLQIFHLLCIKTTNYVQSFQSITAFSRKLILLFLLVNFLQFAYSQTKPDTIIVKQETQIYDTVYVQDTIHITDTIFEESHIYKSVGISIGYAVPIMQYPNIEKSVAIENRALISQHFGINAGIDFKLDFKNTSMSFGAQYQALSNNFYFEKNSLSIDTTTFYIKDSTLHWDVDTIDFYYQEIEDDTLTVYVTDSSQYWKTDSTINYIIDSLATDSTISTKNRLRQINVPIIFHKPLWIANQHVLYGSAGIIGAFIINENITYLQDNILINRHNQTIQFRPYLLFGLIWEQYIGDYFSLESHINYLFNPIPQDPQYSNLNIKLLLRYYF
jgi:hypothetical protein